MPKGISETAFASQVEDLLKLFGWRWTHFRPAWSNKGYRTAIKGDKGFPDYCAVKGTRLLFIELKDQYSKLTPEQEAWQKDLTSMRDWEKQAMEVNHINSGVEVYLWRPADFDFISLCLR